jgi:hypothetical protein
MCSNANLSTHTYSTYSHSDNTFWDYHRALAGTERMERDSDEHSIYHVPFSEIHAIHASSSVKIIKPYGQNPRFTTFCAGKCWMGVGGISSFPF